MTPPSTKSEREWPAVTLWRYREEAIVHSGRTPHGEFFDFETETYLPQQQVEELERALRQSAEALHDLSEDPEHLRNLFSECPNHYCVSARAALAAFKEASERG